MEIKKTEVKPSLIEQAFKKNADFEKARNLTETKLNCTIKTVNDIKSVAVLNMFKEFCVSDKEQSSLSVSVKSLNKSTAKKLGLEHLF